jgi:hypothetical protein
MNINSNEPEHVESIVRPLVDLYHQHMMAKRAGDVALQNRLYNLINEMRWAFPDAAHVHDCRSIKQTEHHNGH